MEEGGMEDLGDGVSKLADFSTVLSSVTRTLDKNVRRLESEFTKCNSSFKEMKVMVEEQRVVTERLKTESDQQQACLSAAVAANAEAGQPLQPSKFLANELDAVIRLGASETGAGAGADAWSKIKTQSDTGARVALDQAVNDAVHVLNKTLLEEFRKMTADKGTAAADANPKRVGKNATPGQAIGALIQRMYDAENALAMQTTLNEAIVKALRDDTYLRNSHNALSDVCAGLAKDIKGIRADHNQLVVTVDGIKSSLDKLTAAFEKNREDTEEVARGGRLRVERRRKRLLGRSGGGGGGGAADDDDDDDDADADSKFVNNGLDGFTLEESDLMLQKVVELERRVFGPTGLEPKVATLDQNLGDVTADVGVLKNQQEEVQAWIEANSNDMLNKIAALRVRWDSVLGDINFGLNQFSNERGGQGEDSAFFVKLGDLYDSIENSLHNFSGNNKTEDETLDVLCPLLDKITFQVDELAAMDDAVSAAMASGKNVPQGDDAICFKDILSLNKHNQTLREALEQACTASITIIDERVPKIHMKRRIDALEKSGAKKDDLDRLKAALKKGLDKQRNDNKDVADKLKNKASLDDLKKLRSLIGRGGGGGGGGSVSGGGSVGSFGGGGGGGGPSSPGSSVHEEPSVDSFGGDSLLSSEEKWGGGQYHGRDDDDPDNNRPNTSPQHGGGGLQQDAASAAALADISQRLELVVHQFKDLQAGCALFVPRDEVHEAMTAVLHEIKLVKLNSVNVNRFKAGMDTKADAEEVARLVETLNSAVGDMLGTNVAAAGKLRCLLCDKPVGSVVKDVEKRKPGMGGGGGGGGSLAGRDASPERSHLLEGGVGAGGSSIITEATAAAAGRPASVGGGVPRLAMPSMASSSPSAQSKLVHEKAARITSELTVLRNSIDLPLVDQGWGGGGGGGDAGGVSRANLKDAYRQRIRGAGGGGFASPAENTR